jgi:hypothetical protein
VLVATTHWQRWVVLAPAFVVGIGLIIAVLILLGRALSQSIRESGHARAILFGLGGITVLVVVLTYFGVSLPKE